MAAGRKGRRRRSVTLQDGQLASATARAAAAAEGAVAGPPAGGFRPFPDARKYVRALRMQSCMEWFAWSRSSRRPADIPLDPARAYEGKGWKGGADFLGCTKIMDGSLRFVPFWEAREYARGLKIMSKKAWAQWSRSPKRPPWIPSNPIRPYRTQGVSLSISSFGQSERYSTVTLIARGMKLTRLYTFISRTRSSLRSSLRSSPPRVGQWAGWADFLGYPKGRVRAPKNWSESDEFGRIMRNAEDEFAERGKKRRAKSKDKGENKNDGGDSSSGTSSGSDVVAGSEEEAGSEASAAGAARGATGATSERDSRWEVEEQVGAEQEQQKAKVQAGFEGSEAYHKRKTMSLML